MVSLDWSIVDLRCVNYCYTAKRFSYTYIHFFSCLPLWFIMEYWIFYIYGMSFCNFFFFLSLARLLHREQGFQCKCYAGFQPNAHMASHLFPSWRHDKLVPNWFAMNMEPWPLKSAWVWVLTLPSTAMVLLKLLHLSASISSFVIWEQFSAHMMCVLVVQSFLTLWLPWTVAHQAPLSMGFSRQEYWSGLPCPPPGDLLDPGMEPASLVSPAVADRS